MIDIETRILIVWLTEKFSSSQISSLVVFYEEITFTNIDTLFTDADEIQIFNVKQLPVKPQNAIQKCCNEF